MKDFRQLDWSDDLVRSARSMLQIALEEDSNPWGDITSQATVPADRTGRVCFRNRQPGVIAGVALIEIAAELFDADITVEPQVEDGHRADSMTSLATVSGSARSILALERPVLNLLGRLSGIATQTHQWASLVEGTQCRIYDTRKTTPGLRLLEKYAVRCGGGHNHRTNLADGILIKDNHLALGGSVDHQPLLPSLAVQQARSFLSAHENLSADATLIEVEVDSWEQFLDAMSASPDLILLDNMSPEMLARAVAVRNETGSSVQLEASGGITAKTLPGVARAGVDRVSLGALTHSVSQIDIGLDWI